MRGPLYQHWSGHRGDQERRHFFFVVVAVAVRGRLLLLGMVARACVAISRTKCTKANL